MTHSPTPALKDEIKRLIEARKNATGGEWKHYNAMIRTEVEGYGTRRIADVLGISEQTVARRDDSPLGGFRDIDNDAVGRGIERKVIRFPVHNRFIIAVKRRARKRYAAVSTNV